MRTFEATTPPEASVSYAVETEIVPRRVFVAGATGVLGRELIPQLLEAGHTVLGLARTPEKLLQVVKMGAKAVRGDVLEPETMRRVVQESAPDVVVNLATVIPLKLRVNPADWVMNDRVRVEGTSNLLKAAEGLPLRLFIQESVGYVSQSQADAWIDENTPLSSHAFVQATIDMERRVRESELPTTVLRFGALLSDDSWHAQQSVAAIRKGLLPIIGQGESYMSLIHTHDAGRAIVHLMDQADHARGRVWIASEEEPAQSAEIIPFVAELLKSPSPRRVPAMLARALVGAVTIEVLGASYRLSSRRLREDLGFRLVYPTYREIWSHIAGQVEGKSFKFTEFD